MNRNKKSFLLHIDSLDILDDLTDEQAGQLFKAIRSYQKQDEFELDSFVRIAFSPFKNQFVRDNEKYDITCKRRAEAGRKGGEAKSANASKPKQEVANASKPKQEVANASKPKQEVANLADSNNKSKNKTKSDSDNEITTTSAKANHSFDLFKYWCDVMGKSISTSKLTPKRDKAIKARLKEGYTVEQIKAAIDGCRNDPFSMGQNDRQKPFNDITLICRDGEKLEFFIGEKVQILSPTEASAQSDWHEGDLGL